MTPLEIVLAVFGALVLIVQTCTVIAINRLYQSFDAITVPAPASEPPTQANQGEQADAAGDSNPLPAAPDGCGIDCDDTHMYDGYCTEDAQLDGIISHRRGLGEPAGWAWSCMEDDGCGWLSLDHGSASAARRSYDRHRASNCPRHSFATTPPAAADRPTAGVALTDGGGEGPFLDSLRRNLRLNPETDGEQP